MNKSVGGSALSTHVRSRHPVFVDGCERPHLCRLRQVRQIRSLRRIFMNLSVAASSPKILGQLRQLPRPCRRSGKTDVAKAVEFWERIGSTVKSLALTNATQARRFLPRSPTKRTRHSFSFSLSLLGKALMQPCDCFSAVSCAADNHSSAISREDPVDLAYLGFVGDMASRIFSKGWDTSYSSSAVSCVVSTNACEERGRKHFGALRSFDDQFDYLEQVLGDKEPVFSPTGRFSTVLSAGKVRPLSIMHSSYEILRPLHKTLYNYLSRFPWLLRGSPFPERFPFASEEGDFVSVDFSNATDNLSTFAAERILGVALCRARNVPETIKKVALESLRPTLRYYNRDGWFWRKLRMGQMMGSLLSFPILCLQTFFFYLWSTGQTNLAPRQLRRFDRCLVNGDDLVFKTTSPHDFFSSAATTLSEINHKKTQVDSRYFNINSTLFEFFNGKVRHVPFIRPAQIDLDSPVSIGRRVYEATRWLDGPIKDRLFNRLMTESVRIVKEHGWSLFKAGFSGRKQCRWLKDFGAFSYETEVFIFNQSERPWSPPTTMDEPMMPLPTLWEAFDRDSIVALNGVFSAFGRFNLRRPDEREGFDEEKLLRAHRYDLGFAKASRDSMWKKYSKFGLFRKLNSGSGSRFPLDINGVRYCSRKEVRVEVRKRIEVQEKGEEVIARRMVEFLDGFRPGTLTDGSAKTWSSFRIHPAVVNRVMTICSRVKPRLTQKKEKDFKITKRKWLQ